ncbi:MAG TPA: nucleotide exchange factor GrpE [Spirochaetota bacterium]|nr:nucleotide exchange factor GrpE [Spirochaetota bacterium]
MSKKKEKQEQENKKMFEPDEEILEKKDKKEKKTENDQKRADKTKNKEEKKEQEGKDDSARKIEELNKKIEEYEAKINEYEDMIKRQQAEFNNFRNRTLKEKEELAKYSVADIFKMLIPIKDNFERALEEDYDKKKIKSILEGFKMVLTQLNDLFKEYNVEECKGVGEEFDPQQHQSIACETDENVDTDTVSEVFQKGYCMYDRVLRTAQVKIKQAPKK